MGASRKIDSDRLDLVEELYSRGWSTREIEGKLSKRFKVTRRQVRTYLALVRARLAAKVADAEQPAARNEHRGRIYAILERTVRVSLDAAHPNPTAAANAATRMGEMLGVMAPKKFEHSGTLGIDAGALNDRLTEFLSRKARGAVAGGPAGVPGVGAGDPGAAGAGPDGGGAGPRDG